MIIRTVLCCIVYCSHRRIYVSSYNIGAVGPVGLSVGLYMFVFHLCEQL